MGRSTTSMSSRHLHKRTTHSRNCDSKASIVSLFHVRPSGQGQPTKLQTFELQDSGSTLSLPCRHVKAYA